MCLSGFVRRRADAGTKISELFYTYYLHFANRFIEDALEINRLIIGYLLNDHQLNLRSSTGRNVSCIIFNVTVRIIPGSVSIKRQLR